MSSSSEAHAYRALDALNLGFGIVAKACDVLEELPLFRREKMEASKIMSEELRAGISHHITERLRDREEREWYHFGRLQIERERRIAEIEKLEQDKIKTKGKEENHRGRRQTNRRLRHPKEKALGQKRRR